MKTHISVLLLFCISLFALPVVAQDKTADLAIVVNPTCTMDNIALTDLIKIFKAEKSKNADGNKYVLAMRDAGSPERNAALKAIYNMTNPEFEKFFLQATFAGTVQAAPKQIASVSSLKQFIASAPGAISYMRGSDADASVKVLKIDGKMPGDAGYPLKIN